MTQISKTKCIEICKSNNPAQRRVVRPKFQKHSALKLAGRIILHRHGYNNPQLAAELASRACPEVHTRDSELGKRKFPRAGVVAGKYNQRTTACITNKSF